MSVRKQRVQLICQECRSDFELLPCQLGRGRGKFCSKECANKAMQRGSELHCSWCDSTFYRAASEQSRAETYFCSIACYQEHRAAYIKPNTYKKDGRRHEHRVVAERVLGRPLMVDEVVHHIDGDKHNNAPENLVVFPNQSLHSRCHKGSLPSNDLEKYRLVSHG